ncbi:hypothetical protein [Methylobacterium oxalidis]|uniref:hypothetical protein n=1 Tax=Methylobacterium oxalidis TaxID=944322 RepID=UPI0033151A93
MTKVREGDIVYSYVGQSICAVGTATSKAHDCIRPAEFEKVWERDGWKIAVDYRDVRPKVPVVEFLEELVPLLPSRYGPLDRNGKGRVGYLFELPRDAGELVARAIDQRLSVRSAVRTEPAPQFQPGERVVSRRFGYGTVANVEGNKLTIDFDVEGRKIVMDGYVERHS